MWWILLFIQYRETVEVWQSYSQCNIMAATVNIHAFLDFSVYLYVLTFDLLLGTDTEWSDLG